MTLSITLTCVWVVVGMIIALSHGRYHWPAAYVLIAVGIPLLGFVTYENGPWIGLVVMVGGASMLRWPLFYLGRWLRGKLKG